MTPQQAAEQCLKLQQAGRLEEALACCDLALACARAGAPGLAVLSATRGEVLLDMGRAADALAAFDQALAQDSGLAAAWNNRGLALNALGQPEQALESFARAAALAPASPDPLANHGDMLKQLRRHEEALASFARALALDPTHSTTLYNRAAALAEMGRTEDAIADYSKVLARHPGFAEALFARSHLLARKGEVKAALDDVTRLMQGAPDFPFGRGALMRLKLLTSDWDDFEQQKALLDDAVRSGKKAIAPLFYLAVSDRPEDIHRCARLYAQSHFPAGAPAPRQEPRRPGPIRVGYVCGEFRTHAVLYLLAGLFEAHDRDKFEITAFDNGGGDGGALRARFEKAVDRIIDITRLSDSEAAARIAAEEIDILVDLNGYSGGQRLGVFARRPGRVQVSYLAYPGTLGAPWMDYILADKIVIPETQARDYSEKIAWLPHSYQINDSKRITGKIPSRADAGLPPDGFVFCNFNQAEKRSPQTFSSWMRILAAAPGSVLWLPRPNAVAEQNLKKEAGKRGIAPERLVFAPHVPGFEDHLARLALADLFLDGGPYGAHTTASDALWAGVPLITRMGGAFAGRVAASLLLALGLPELVTASEAEFEALAISLARSPQQLKALRAKLEQARASAPLFDTVRTTRAIERAYQIMLENRARPPESFTVPDQPAR
jgi:predicted O-linked N-acetylglucosamine transferase (SPINDLY family)